MVCVGYYSRESSESSPRMAKDIHVLPIPLLGYKLRRLDCPKIHIRAQSRLLVFFISPSMYTGVTTSGMRDVRLPFDNELRDKPPRGHMISGLGPRDYVLLVVCTYTLSGRNNSG